MTRRILVITTVCLLAAWSMAQAAPPQAPVPSADAASEPTSLPKYLTPEERLLPALPVARDGRQPDGNVHCAAEYEPCEGIFFSWNGYTDLLREMTVTITTHDDETKVFMVVDSASEQTSVTSTLTSAGADMDQVEFIVRATDTVWIRDYGPRFVFEDGVRTIIDHTYNRPRPNDNLLNDYISALWGEPQYDIPLTHGGGNFHLFKNGEAFMTTLILTENPGLSEQAVKDLYAEYQGVDLTIYPGFPTSFDSTQHIDMWMLALGDDKVLIGQYSASDGTPYTITENAAADLASRGYTVYRSPGWNSGGTHYTYTNAIILNDLVFLPKFNHSNDAQALATFEAALPDKEIHQIDCSSIIHAAGAVHCICMHVPLKVALAMTLPDGTPEFITPGEATAITVQIENGAETYVPDSGLLHYRYDGGVYQTVGLTPVSGDLYEAVLPPAACGDTPEFYFTIEGNGGTTIASPADAPATVYTATVAVVATYFDDDCEADLGWTVESVDLTDGAWDRGVPVNCERGDPPADFDGSGQCYLTDNDQSACNSDVDGGPTRLTSPLIDLTGAVDPVLSYARWFTCDDGVPPAQDFLDVEISADDGATWTLIESAADEETWVLREVHVADYIALTNQVRIRFVATDTPNNSVTEAGVDAIRIIEVTCGGPPECAGDMNCDGMVDYDDIDLFVAALSCVGGDPGCWDPACPWLNGDCNDDGDVTYDDIDPFVARIGATCP